MEKINIRHFFGESPLNSIWLAFAVFILGGYIIFFLGVTCPDFAWGRLLIDASFSHVKALNTAKRVAVLRKTNPFAIQLIILYAAYGSIFLTLWAMQFFARKNRLKLVAQFAEKNAHRMRNYSRKKAFFFSLILINYWILFPGILFVHKNKELSWQAKAMFVSSFDAASFLLVGSIACTTSFLLGSFHLYASITGLFKKN